MIVIKDKSKCSGCHACMSVCPKSAIEMKSDDEGFLYPFVDKEKCVDCGLCEKACQAINPIVSTRNPKAYACYNTDEDIRIQSSSGGIFTAIAKWIISQNGVVFGAGFDDNLNVVHMEIDNEKDLSKLRGSKYVQSVIGNNFTKAKEYLDAGRIVLFTGTPCQIDGFLHYLKKDYPNLYTQDLICHGVPSSKVWKKYLEFQEHRFNEKIKSNPNPQFRNKRISWTSYSQVLFFENDKEYVENSKNDLYINAFLSNVSLRPSCYNCHSKTLNRNSDITLADLWGCRNIVPEMFDDKGTSFVMINSEKGKEIFKIISNQLGVREIDLNTAVYYNASAYKSSKLPKKRTWFFQNIDDLKFDELVIKSIKPTFYERIMAFIKYRLISKILNKIKR